jgi:diguanylate cyclase (GGDEF)-like protein
MRLRSLQSRIVLFFVALLVAMQGVTLLLVNAANERNARDNVRNELVVGEKIFRRLLEQNHARLTQAALIVSLDFAFREAAATRDLATIESVLVNHGSRIRADTMALVSLERQVIADTFDRRRAGRPFPFTRLLDAAERDGSAAGMVLVDGNAFQVAVVPVRAPTPIAWTVVGFTVDDRLAKDLGNLAALEVTFVSREAQVWRVLGSSATPELQEALLRALPKGSAAAAAAGDRAVTLDLGGRDYESFVLALDGEDSRIVAVLARSLDEAPYRRLGPLLLLLVLGSIVASIVGSVLIARSVTRPLSLFSAMTRRIEEGDYAQAIDVQGTDEVSELARRFNLMREAIAAREEQILKLAYRDPLSDLPNRVLFNDRLRVALEGARRSGAALTVLVMDLDRFKYINDTLGHHVGDMVLQQVALRITRVVRKSDTTARLGGDEFAVLLVATGVDEARGVAQKIVAALEAPIAIGQHSLDVRASVGIAAFPAHAEDADTLMRRADAAMYSAKRGNTGFAVYDALVQEQREEQLSLLSELRQAIDRGQLRLVYQPKIDLASGTLSGLEALLRWAHPTKGLITPDRFIPFAEQTGFIKTITAWVIEMAVKQGAAWRAAGRPTPISVNISAQDLLNPELGELLTGALERHRLPPQLLCLEITESGVMQDAARAIEVLKRLERLGVRRAIDDFGTGYSSLSYVKQLSVDELKIDRSFLRGMLTDMRDRAIVLSTIDLAHNLGLIVVAEGVEEQGAADMLRALGCDQIQGTLVSRPLEVTALETWLFTRSAAPVSRIS